MATTRKVLMLHGYGQNAYSMSRYMAPILKEVPEDVEFVYLDAPLALVPADINSSTATEVKTRVTAPTPTASPPENDTGRRWFTIVKFGGNTMDGIDTSLELLTKTLKENRFEAIMGFSQGAAVAELVAAMLEKPDLFPSFMSDGVPVHPPLKYIVSVAGFLLRGQLAAWDGQPVDHAFPSFIMSTPVLHVVGHTDVVVPRERADVFMGHHKNKRVEEHIGGHFVPNKPRWRRFYAQFFARPFSHYIASPTSASLLSLASSTSGQVSFTSPPNSGLIAEYRMGEALPSPYKQEEEEEEDSGRSTPDSEGPKTPLEKEWNVDVGAKVLEDARMWDVYAGLVYQGDL